MCAAIWGQALIGPERGPQQTGPIGPARGRAQIKRPRAFGQGHGTRTKCQGPRAMGQGHGPGPIRRWDRALMHEQNAFSHSALLSAAPSTMEHVSLKGVGPAFRKALRELVDAHVAWGGRVVTAPHEGPQIGDSHALRDCLSKYATLHFPTGARPKHNYEFAQVGVGSITVDANCRISAFGRFKIAQSRVEPDRAHVLIIDMTP